MRLFYLLLKLPLFYAMNLFFKKIHCINKPKKFRNQSILVLNHPSSFMDPLLVSAMQNPIVFFMTRSDVFKKGIKWFLWLVHMLPIYRMRDGKDSLEKNEYVFTECFKILKDGRSVLIFGEGFTDDKFVRRLKPIKKGAARIAFGTMEKYNWDFDLKIQCVGINYENPCVIRSNVLISNSEEINVKKYKSIYQENPNKAINILTSEIEKRLQNQITHINNINLCDVHEQIMKITKRGMNNENKNNMPLKERQEYSKKLANYINNLSGKSKIDFLQLKESIAQYFKQIHSKGVKQKDVFEINSKGKLSIFSNIVNILIGFPLFALGFIHMGLPYIFTKWFVEKIAKRPVFWSSIKLILGMFVAGIFNIPFIFIFYKLIFPNYFLAVIYYLIVPSIAFLYAYYYKNLFFDLKHRKKINKLDLSDSIEKYNHLKIEIEKTINF